ncbi:ElyC/SanA/YdcF family protein [Imperialibacter roseus]|uniref:ElyC/SanA/YdcF family protein n=1 Tax=Imperialibacter roseus TaxID=1324217 RepID=A0ABZ0IY80_9BACT|nr:ElyC/SanA/YdcF family protein [Imperialibacter roseus]WOK08905.1 ElyC/SanA/YdcF family protein [Imperialibacter roseus]|tara:strand:- start:13163 stop:13807 length:645 start_codon:yes stop_codon:yes gene_type:complete
MRFLLKMLFMLGALVFAFVIASNVWIMWKTTDDIHFNVEEIPAVDVGVVLGTSKRSVDGGANSFFTTRMEAAAKLYKAGKVKHLILSGDNNTKYYNEPQDMFNALLVLGVPAQDMTMDYAGFRTLDSIVRSKEVFGQNEIVIITQQFHAYRALFISKFYGIKAVTFASDDAAKSGMKSVVSREWLARPKAILDLYVLKQPPKFLGEKEIIEIRK